VSKAFHPPATKALSLTYFVLRQPMMNCLGLTQGNTSTWWDEWDHVDNAPWESKGGD